MANSTIPRQYIVGSVTTSAISVAANGATTTLSVSASKSGYTPIGVVGYTKAGSSSGYVFLSSMYLDGTNIIYLLRNTFSSAATVTTTFYVLYEKA